MPQPHRPARKCFSLAGLLTVTVGASILVAQTSIEVPKNKYTPEQDVQLGRDAAMEVEKETPLLNDARALAFVRRVGADLERAIPSEFQHPEFSYSFKVVNEKDINAFALPGGPMYVNRGMIEAATTEGEVAGVMAHELSHVALRHGTAQMTKAEKYQWSGVAGAVVGAIIGGGLGQAVYQGSQFGVGAVLMRFSRDYEKQADLLGSHIMARAGYDPVDMANMFRTIEEQSGGSGPQWLSDHPNPGNRREYIEEEARHLNVERRVRDSGELADLQGRFRGMPPAPSAEEVARRRRSGSVSSARR